MPGNPELAAESDEFSWARTFGAARESDHGQAATPANDGGLIVAGDLALTPLAGTPAKRHDETLVARLSRSGRVLWQRTLHARRFQYVEGVAQASDGTIGLLAWRSSDPQFRPPTAYLYRLSREGRVLSIQRLREDFRPLGLVTSGAGFIAWGMADPYAGPLHVMRIRRDGGAEWDAEVAGDFGPVWSEVAATRDGGAVVAGSEDVAFGPAPDRDLGGDLTVLRLTRDGSVAWRVRDRMIHGIVRGVAVAPGGEIAVTGDHHGAYGEQPGHGGQDVFVARFDAHGAPEGLRLYGGTDTEWPVGLAVTAEGFVIAGLTGSPRFEGERRDGHTFVLHVDSAGNPATVAVIPGVPEAMTAVNGATYVVGTTPSRSRWRPGDILVVRAD